MIALPFQPAAAILVIPAVAAAILTMVPNYRAAARLNVLASFLTMLAALLFFVTERPEVGRYLFVDDLNIVFIVLNTFVGF
ncbi:MAG TPA: hydrogenase 4 subunit F, partial [Hyphomicrobiaceae bacterium]|nr:hydrogenase 4 subunit F [Hyphomicrobiaceae bacterium]